MAYNFDTIARGYDRMNHLMTLGLDRWWRRRAVKGLHGNVLDVACGTGDMVLELQKRGCDVTGVDLSEEMLAVARRKFTHSFPLATLGFPSHPTCSARHATGMSLPNLGEEPDSSSSPKGRGRMTFLRADAESLPFPDAFFDAVTCAFGVRNFVHLEQGLNEMLRVLKPGGRMVILELATPDNPLLNPFYNFYTKRIIPWLGSRIAGNRVAYTYLPESIERFPKGDAFLQTIQNSEFKIQNSCQRKLTGGVCRMYTINKEAAVPERPLCH